MNPNIKHNANCPPEFAPRSSLTEGASLLSHARLKEGVDSSNITEPAFIPYPI